MQKGTYIFGSNLTLEEMQKWPLAISLKAENGKASIRIEGAIWEWNNSAANFREAVEKAIADGITDVELYINSPGGVCFEANEIVNVIKEFKGTITGRGGALVASCATYIASHCTTFHLAENGQYMIHLPWGWTQGNSYEIRSYLQILENENTNYAKAYSKKTGSTEDEALQLMRDETWMNAEKALAEGFIDGISGKEEVPAAQAKTIRTIVGAMRTKPVAIPQPSPQSNQHNNPQNTMDKKLWAVLLGLDENATEEQMKARALVLKKAEEELGQLKAVNANVEKNRKATDITALLDDAVKTKRITAEQRPSYQAMLEADFDTNSALLKALTPVKSITDSVTEAPQGASAEVPAERKAWDWDKWAAEDVEGLHALSYEAYNKLYSAAYGHDADKARHAALQTFKG